MTAGSTRGVGSSACHYRSGGCTLDSSVYKQPARPAHDLRQCTHALPKRYFPSAAEQAGRISVSQRSCALDSGAHGPALCNRFSKSDSISRRTQVPSNAAFLDRWLGRGAITDPSPADAALDGLSQQGLGLGPDVSRQQQSTAGAPPAPLLSGAGGGIFFFHQLGALQYMQERYEMADDTVAYVGASAGSLLVVLAACGVSAEETLVAADRLAQRYGVFERPLGVAGIWGAVIRDWLDELLPDDALERCRSRVHLVVTKVPSFKQQYLTDFSSRDDLLDAALASAHVPFLLNWSPVAAARGGWFVDGSLRDFILWNNSHLLTCGGAAYILDYSQDEELKTGRLDFMGLRDVEGARKLMALGYAHAERNAARIEQHFGLVAR